eukprot:8325598-Pyramimonas_sp.AAC.1
MHAWNLPSRPCAHATASLSALTSVPFARALIRIFCASTSARGGHALGRLGLVESRQPHAFLGVSLIPEADWC